jgi:hypothetical protein
VFYKSPSIARIKESRKLRYDRVCGEDDEDEKRTHNFDGEISWEMPT